MTAWHEHSLSESSATVALTVKRDQGPKETNHHTRDTAQKQSPAPNAIDHEHSNKLSLSERPNVSTHQKSGITSSRNETRCRGVGHSYGRKDSSTIVEQGVETGQLTKRLYGRNHNDCASVRQVRPVSGSSLFERELAL